MDHLPSFLEGRLDQIAYTHIRERLLQLRQEPKRMLEYINELFLDTRDGTRRGFDFTTASALMDIKQDLMVQLGELAQLHDQAGVPDTQFKGSLDRPLSGYQPAKLPKGW
jgi:hypothetical protein